ncbi:hypothetical protein M0R45_006001 [Rubus argutus]|uniref:Smr domain-containing protein n=1 Tax=Rubus argutus TaxID=59490 RepID=A0AAW1YPS8_RUBAR
MASTPPALFNHCDQAVPNPPIPAKPAPEISAAEPSGQPMDHPTRLSLKALTLPPQPPRTAPKPPAAAPTPLSQNPTFSSLCPLPPPKSDLVTAFSGRRSTRFVSKMHFGRPKTTVGSRHSSLAEEALQSAIQFGKDDLALNNVLLSFESKLCGSDDYTFLLRELGNRGECWKAIRCFEFAVRRERRRTEQGKLASSMISTLGSPNLVTYNAVIDACGKGGVEFKRVVEIFNEMLKIGVQPDRITYNSLLAVCSRGGLWEAARNLFSEMVDRGIDQDIYTYNTLLDAICKGFEEALNVCKEMESVGIVKDVVSYNALLGGYGKQGKYDEVKACGMYKEAMEVLESLSRQGSRLMSYFISAQLMLLLEAIVLHSDNRIMKMFGQLAAEKAGYGKNGRQVRQEILCILGVFQKMHELDIKPNVVTFSAILNACSRCNSFEDASMLLEELRLFDNQVYGVAHGLLMGYRDNVWVNAQSLFDEVKQMDCSTASAFYNALTDMLWHFGQKQGAQLVVLEGKRRTNVWENVWSNSCLDLHLMSSGAARAMVHAWLLNIRSIVSEGQQLPNLLSILTGWGKHSNSSR